MDIKKYKKENISPKRTTSDGYMPTNHKERMQEFKSKKPLKKVLPKEVKDEKKGIKEYSEDVKKSKGKKKEVYKEILSDEKKHLKALKKI